MSCVERFTALMYSICSANSMNEARKLMFTHSLKALECIPQTQHASIQHIKGELIVVAFIWKQLLYRSPDVPNTGHGGMQERRYGCHDGQIYLIPAMDAHCYSTVSIWLQTRVTANEIELECAVGYCVGVKEAA
jgi:hypothetical protein